jgi:hypothetical protein
MAARTFYIDEDSGNILIADNNNYTAAELADMAADVTGNLDSLVFHTDFNFVTIQGVVSISTVSVTSLPRHTETWSDGGGGCKIICSKLFEYGLLPSHIYAADQEFGFKLKNENPEAYAGYIKWAQSVVDWMETSGPNIMFWIRDKELREEKQRNCFINLTKTIATPWAHHMAYLMGYEQKDNKTGKRLMSQGLAICKLFGKYTNTEKEQSILGKYLTLFTIGPYFYLLSRIN